MMKWTDTPDIAIALTEEHPDVDPATGALHRSCTAGWRSCRASTTIPKRSGEKILEAIQSAWIEEAD